MTTTKVIKITGDTLSKEDLSHCSRVLENSGIIIFPTDTVYGIACNGFDPVAIQKIYELKGRDYNKPLPILLGSQEQLPLVAKEVPKEAYRFADKFWPGSLTLVLKTAQMATHAAHGRETIAIRIPDHGVVKQILDAKKIPIAATSANQSGEESISSGKDVLENFMDRVDLIIDGGECAIGQASSVVDATQYPFTVLREGAISKQKLLEALG